MGRFDHLRVGDSDSNSSDEPSPRDATEPRQERGDSPQALSETHPGAQLLLTDIPSAFQTAGIGEPKSQHAASSLGDAGHPLPPPTPSPRSASDAGSRKMASRHSSLAYSGASAGGQGTPTVPSVGLAQQASQTQGGGGGSVAFSGAQGSVRSGAGSVQSRGLPARRHTPSSARVLHTPSDQPQSTPQPLSIAKEETPNASALPGGAAQAPSHHRTILSRTPTTSSSAARSPHSPSQGSQHTAASRVAVPEAGSAVSGAPQDASSGGGSLSPAEGQPPSSHASHKSSERPSATKGLSEKEESINNDHGAVPPPTGPVPVLDEEEYNGTAAAPAPDGTAPSYSDNDAKARASSSSLVSQQQLSGSGRASRSGTSASSVRSGGAAAAALPVVLTVGDHAQVADAVPSSAAGPSAAAAATTTAGAAAVPPERGAAKQAKAKAGCGFFSFCRRKKRDEPLVATEHDEGNAATQSAAVAADVGQPPQQTLFATEHEASVHASASELGTPPPRAPLTAESKSSSKAPTPGQASVHVGTPRSSESPALRSAKEPSHHGTSADVVTNAESSVADGQLPATEVAGATQEAPEAAAVGERGEAGSSGAAAGLGTGEPSQQRRKKRVRVRKQREAPEAGTAPKSAEETEEETPTNSSSANSLPSSPSQAGDRPASATPASSQAGQKSGHGRSAGSSSLRGSAHAVPVAAEAAEESVPAAVTTVPAAANENGRAEPGPMMLLAERGRTPTPNDVPFPVPESAHQRQSSTAVVRSVHGGSASRESSSEYRSSPLSDASSSRTPDSRIHTHHRDNDEDDDGGGDKHGSEGGSNASYSYSAISDPEHDASDAGKRSARGERTEFVNSTDGAGLTMEANDMLTNGLEDEQTFSLGDEDERSQPQQHLGQDHDDDGDLQRLPPYQRRLLLDMRAKQRRELEELAKDWPELTFRPAINPSPQYTITNDMPFSDRLSRSHPPSPGAHSVPSGEAASGAATPHRRRGGSRCTYTGEPTPSFALEISPYARSRPQSPRKVFERLTEKPKEQAPATKTEERDCTFAPEISERSKQLAPSTNVFTRLSRLPKRSAGTATREAAEAEAEGATPSPHRANRSLSGSSPSPRRSGTSRADGGPQPRESVFERLYRQRKTPQTSPQTSPQRSGKDRYEHQPQITASARRLSTSRLLQDADFGERLHQRRRAKREGEDAAEPREAAEPRPLRHTPFYPSASDCVPESTGSGDHHSGKAVARSRMDDTLDNGIHSGYYGSASESESGHGRGVKASAVPQSV